MDAWAARRRDYDAGILDAAGYWQWTLEACRVRGARGIVAERLSELVEIDISAWMEPRVAVHELLNGLLDRGAELAILSNMPRGVGARFVAAWPWIKRIGLRHFSGDEGLAKPDPAFYRHFLEKSGWLAEETLFVDDSAANIETAASLGFAVHHFTEEAAALEALRAWAL
jgi:HAD superfamily hydrolase (TIGR01509 family)